VKIRQLVQVRIMGAPRTYTYAWEWDPHEGDKPLAVGDKVELPPNQVQEEGSSGTVVELGSPYNGPVKPIVRVIEPKSNYRIVETGPPDDPDGGLTVRPVDDDLWAGFGEGDYA
jgi:hypothetical protein